MQRDHPHRRLNLLTREWVLVSPQRAGRPWQGQVEQPPASTLPAYDPQCYLCPGNTRISGARNPHYTTTFVFDNDFAALLPEETDGCIVNEALLVAEAERGLCRVVCFSPRHDLTLPQLSSEQLEAVVRTWVEQTRELGAYDFINYVQVFENKGAAMGCSNPHPHGQIWATTHVPNEPAKELAAQTEYREQYNSCLLCDYGDTELRVAERLVALNEHFVAVAPFWAIWPFEVLLLAREHVATLLDLNAAQVTALATILREITARYDGLFAVSFPYSMGFHQAPSDGRPHPEWHFHAHFYPPLLRSATVKKFMVGFELLAMPQRDITPETAAERLRNVVIPA